MSTSTPKATDPAEQKQELQTEAAELRQDLKEAEGEAAAARKAGDDERADRLEASITETKAELAEVKGLLKQLVERPFAPAPGDADKQEQEQAPAPGDAEKQEQEQAPAPSGEDKPKKKHWMFGDRWNEE